VLRSALFSDLTQCKKVVSYRRFGRSYRSHLQGWRSQSCPPYTNSLIPFSASSVSCFSSCSFYSYVLLFCFSYFSFYFSWISTMYIFSFKFSFLHLVVAVFSWAVLPQSSAELHDFFPLSLIPHFPSTILSRIMTIPSSPTPFAIWTAYLIAPGIVFLLFDPWKWYR